ncbi:TATA box-binding protein-associated factor RNA polymerase I subunit B [Diretmus argenteus]
MDEELTGGYREPCGQCSAVDWGVSDEGRFYCRSCHNVIERTEEVVDTSFLTDPIRISNIAKGTRHKKPERGRRWMICEGFQFILRDQADALLTLGVCPHLKDTVWRLWRSYLQTTRQAYTANPVRAVKFKLVSDSEPSDVSTSTLTLCSLEETEPLMVLMMPGLVHDRAPSSESDSAAEGSMVSASETDGDCTPGSASGRTGQDSEENNGNSSDGWSACSGSVDALTYLTPRQKRSRGLMSMRKTLAFLHLALLWTREAITLTDLLRLVNEGHVPYVNAYESFPEEMKLHGRDALLFRVQSVPSYARLHQESQALANHLELPCFPPISQQCLLHPALLTLRYLTAVNLPDELHVWVCRVMEGADMADESFNTFEPRSRSGLPLYDLQAAALIIVTMKFIFGIDDHTEWDLSNDAGDRDKEDPEKQVFILRRWYKLLQPVLTRAKQRRLEETARKQWKSPKPLYPSRKDKCVVLKKRRISEQLQICFEKLSGSSLQHSSPSSFRFCWGDGEGSDGPSLHHKILDGVMSLKGKVLMPSNQQYWHPAPRPCNPRTCSSHYKEVEPTLPRGFVWLLELFSFLLEVKPSCLMEEVQHVEQRLLRGQTPRSTTTKAPPRKRPRHRKTGTTSSE